MPRETPGYCVKGNGVVFNPTYVDKLFERFQWLH
jgi:hypothetical protein